MNSRYQVSNNFKEECKQNIGKANKIGRIHIVEDNIDITENDNLIDFTIEDNCYVNDKFIGTTVAKKITVNILNPNNEIDLENKEIEVYIGMIINGIKEEIPFGNFIIEKPENEEVKEKTSFVGYDYMIKFNTKYENRLTYPKKLSVVLEDLCNQVGLELESTDFVNANYMVLGNPFTDNEDRRTVLSNIAQLAGGFAKISRNNKVYIKTLSNLLRKLTVKEIDEMLVKVLQTMPVEMTIKDGDKADEFIDGNNYFDDFSKNQQWGELNSLVIGLSDIEGENISINDETSIAQNGLTEMQINDNYYLINEAERRKVITPIWDKIKKMKYIPFKSEYYGYPYLDSGDTIYIEDTKGNKYISYVFNHTFTFNGAYSGIIDTSALTKTQTAYKNKIDTKTRFRRVERKIDKIKGVIEDVIEEQTETERKLSQYKQTVDEVTITVSTIEENLDENYYTKTETNSQITQKANEINLKVEAIQTDISGKVDKTLVISQINLSTEGITIKGSKISLEGVITANKTFKINTNGSIECIGGKIGGFTIDQNALYSSNVGITSDPSKFQNYAFWAGANTANIGSAPFRVTSTGGVYSNSINLENATNKNNIYSNTIRMSSAYGLVQHSIITDETASNKTSSVWQNIATGESTIITEDMVKTDGFMYAKNFINTSEALQKENIEEFNNDALNIITNADIYQYNFVGGKEKNIGLVIGENYKDIPKEILRVSKIPISNFKNNNKNGNKSKKSKIDNSSMNYQESKGVDLYSMCSIAWKAIQELNKKIEEITINGGI